MRPNHADQPARMQDEEEEEEEEDDDDDDLGKLMPHHASLAFQDVDDSPRSHTTRPAASSSPPPPVEAAARVLHRAAQNLVFSATYSRRRKQHRQQQHFTRRAGSSSSMGQGGDRAAALAARKAALYGRRGGAKKRAGEDDDGGVSGTGGESQSLFFGLDEQQGRRRNVLREVQNFFDSRPQGGKQQQLRDGRLKVHSRRSLAKRKSGFQAADFQICFEADENEVAGWDRERLVVEEDDGASAEFWFQRVRVAGEQGITEKEPSVVEPLVVPATSSAAVAGEALLRQTSGGAGDGAGFVLEADSPRAAAAVSPATCPATCTSAPATGDAMPQESAGNAGFGLEANSTRAAAVLPASCPPAAATGDALLQESPGSGGFNLEANSTRAAAVLPATCPPAAATGDALLPESVAGGAGFGSEAKSTPRRTGVLLATCPSTTARSDALGRKSADGDAGFGLEAKGSRAGVLPAACPAVATADAALGGRESAGGGAGFGSEANNSARATGVLPATCPAAATGDASVRQSAGGSCGLEADSQPASHQDDTEPLDFFSSRTLRRSLESAFEEPEDEPMEEVGDSNDVSVTVAGQETSLSQAPQDSQLDKSSSKPRSKRRRMEVDKRKSLAGAGTKWEDGRRRSTRIRLPPVQWWNNEKLLYARVSETLCTLVGVKKLLPDTPPVGRRRKDKSQKFEVKSFVSPKWKNLVNYVAL